MGFAVVVSRIGTMLAPYILLMGQFSPVIFGVSALLSGLCALMLPETLGQQMPETLQDGETYEVCWTLETKIIIVIWFIMTVFTYFPPP